MASAVPFLALCQGVVVVPRPTTAAAAKEESKVGRGLLLVHIINLRIQMGSQSHVPHVVVVLLPAEGILFLSW